MVTRVDVRNSAGGASNLQTFTAGFVFVDEFRAYQIPLTFLGVIRALLVASSAAPMSLLAPPASSIKGAMTATFVFPSAMFVPTILHIILLLFCGG